MFASTFQWTLTKKGIRLSIVFGLKCNFNAALKIQFHRMIQVLLTSLKKNHATDSDARLFITSIKIKRVCIIYSIENGNIFKTP